MENSVRIATPLKDHDLERLVTGERMLLNGFIYSARDAAHQRLVKLLRSNKPLPLDFQGQVIYYVGPTPGKSGKPVGSAGPTTSYRMDPYTPALIRKGLKGMIGKGPRNQAVKAAMKKYKAVYFAAIGGAGALMAQSILSAEVIAYPELGTEAIRRMEVRDLPVTVVNDIHGGDLYESGVRRYVR